MAILSDASSALEGKTLIQLTSDTGTAADELAEWSAAHNADYLDGVILAYPSDMGSPDATVLLAGDIEAWNAVEPLIRDIAGASVYVGDNVRVPSMLSAAAIAPLLGMVVGAAQGAAMCEAEGFPVADYAAMMSPLSGLLADQMQQTLATIAEDRFENPEAALKTYASSVTDRTAEGRSRGVNVEFYGFVDDLLTRALNQGLGDEELSAIIKLWR
jgi:3-hydroxyisobutyrate dehydrogenase-like beta-hydroxyacid dehydrogenase